ncbi:hypothetical protein CWS43_20435, partial [Rahnella sp. AA]|uniref:autotransporter family protein n=1 Tax=Rahnella sp. AA TaxID=2057180 RepID=UPI000CAD833D
TTDTTTIGKYQLNGKRLTVNNIKTSFTDNSLTDGDIAFNSSNVTWGGRDSLLSSNGSLTVGNGTTLELRDVKQTEGINKTLVLDGGAIASGTNGNGGGSGATLRSALRVDTTGTLNGNNWGFRINLGLYGPISGKGTLNITGSQGVSFFGDTSAFTGNLLLKTNSRLYLAPVEDTVLAANLSKEGTGKAVKQGIKNLTLTGDNHLYTNELEVQAGTLTLGSTTAATGGDIRMTAGTLKLDADSKVSLSNLAAGGTVDLHGHSGTLNIKANEAGSAITSSDVNNGSSLNLLVNSSSTLNSTISGQKIHLNKQGTGDLTLAASNTFTGDVLLSAGKTIAGNLNAFGAAANIVSVAKNALLDLNGNSVLNNLNLASGTLVNSKAGALKLGTLSLSDNSTATFNGITDTTTIGKYQLNGKRLTVNNIKTSFTDNSLTDGDIAFNSSNVTWGGRDSLLSSNGSLTVGNGTTLELRDVKQTEGINKTLVLDGGTIASGTNGNGGGSGATLRSALRVDTTGTLNGNNWGFRINLGLYGPISGKGTLNITGSQGVSFFGDTSAFTGNLLLKTNSRLYLAPVEDTVLAANLSKEGTGKAVKQGIKNLTLTGDNHLYTNELEVQGGTLTLGSVTAATGGDMRIQTSATLNSEYNNTVGGSLYNSGTVKLKRAGSSLNVKGNYTQQSNAVLGIAIDPILGAAMLNVTGSATVAGTLNAIYAPGTYIAQTYTVLSALKGVKGSFAKVTQEGGAGISQKIGYTTNNVTLATSKAAGVKSLRSSTPESSDGGEELSVVETQFTETSEIVATDEQQPETENIAFAEDDVLAALTFTAVEQDNNTVMQAILDAEEDTLNASMQDETFVVTPDNLRAYDVQRLSIGMQKPTQWSMEQVDWSAASGGKSACDLADACYHDDAMWIMPHMSNGRLSADNGNAKANGISIGGYTEIADTRVGVSVDYSDFDLSDNGSSATQNRYAVNLFASQKLSRMVLTGSLGYTHAPTDVTRQVTMGGFNPGEGKSHISGDAVSGGLSLNWPVQMGNTQIVPQIGLDSLNVFYSGFDENMSSNGEEFNSFINSMKVQGNSKRYDSLQPNIGVKVSQGLAWGNTEVTPALKVTYRRELMNDNNGTVASNDGTVFTVQSDTLGRDIVEYEAGVDVKFTPRLSTSFSYTGSNQQGYQSQEGMIRVKYNF